MDHEDLDEGEGDGADPQDQTVVQPTPARGTVANFNAINANIVTKLVKDVATLSKETCNLLLENKRLAFYGMGFDAEQVFEEMVRLVGMNAHDILSEISPEEEGEHAPKKRARQVDYSTPASPGDDDADVVNEREEDAETHSSNPNPKQPKLNMSGSIGQRMLSTMWSTQSTSQQPNNQQNGSDQS